MDPRLERFLPVRVVLRTTGDEPEGLMEESFSMAWSPTRINIFWSGKAYSILGEHVLHGPDSAQHNARLIGGEVFDPLDPTCPIEVDLSAWLDTLENKAADKFNKRNAWFKPRKPIEILWV